MTLQRNFRDGKMFHTNLEKGVYGTNNMIKDEKCIFRELFNDENALRELYSALSGQEIDPDESIEIVTLEDAIFNSLKNDLSFTIGSKIIVLIEQQSTDSPNLALRLFIYLANQYDKMLDKKKIYSTSKVSIPKPELYVFYNGKDDRQEEWEQKLSDLFAVKSNELTRYGQKKKSENFTCVKDLSKAWKEE